MKVKVGVSNRHVHLTEEVYYKLFDTDLIKKNDLSQKGEFAAIQTVKISTPNGEIDNVRIVGPLRNYNQVEILRSDAYKLGINPPTRPSGDLKNSENITISTDKATISLEESCIIQEFHIHMNPTFANKYKIKNRDLIKVCVKNGKDAIIFAHAKVSDNGVLEFQIDLDDANSLNLKNKDEVEIII